ncbi:hypothetical protein [Geomesophilobacter sediminis]|uniref:MtrB/PioB family decaheme-associated outer membrane protein n=1 Tax=Geomesophilobacter sediminis TaxID=2798584 RepID=A0A8J7M320_9BACT|nr:hypothetical protein [Geomesophilobacter sediminis]MBJ6727614.1 hypothetical protein [Geomesophilobacter sediminis]
MIRPPELARRALFLLLFAAFPALPALAQGEPAEQKEPIRELPRTESGDPAAGTDEDHAAEIREEKGGYLGYRFLSTEKFGGRALDYGLLRSSKSGGLFFRRLEKDRSFELEGDFLNEKEYNGDLYYDYRGDYRVHLHTDSLFHNLDRQLLVGQNPNLPSPNPITPIANFSVLSVQGDSPSTQYGIGVSQDLATFRYRLHDFPLHVNLGYWRLVREGDVQQRFADVSFDNAANTVYARPRHENQVTQEGSVGFDAHLGWVDLIYQFQIRVFEDRQPPPVDPFDVGSGGGVHSLVHNENPDSRFMSHTVKAHSTLSDGIVGSASYSVAIRENRSGLAGAVGGDNGRTTVQNVAGDFTYTPCKEFTAALKYRRQDLDRDGFGTLGTTVFGPGEPKPGVESTKDLFIGTFSVRPALNLSLTGEYRGEMVSRTNVSSLPTPTTWALPENSATQTGSLALLYRPLRGSRVTAKYIYQTTDHPAYGNSFQQKHQGEVLGAYTGRRWGMSANAIVKREWNDDTNRFAFLLQPGPLVPMELTSMRERRSQNVSANLWYALTERINLTAQYAYLHTFVDQGSYFTSFSPTQVGSSFTSRARVAGIGASANVTERFDLGLDLQRIWSASSFDPQGVAIDPANTNPLAVDTTGIRELTAQNTTISRVSVRGGYRFTNNVSASIEYILRDYNEKNVVYSNYNGTVHSVVAYLSSKW